MAYRIKEFRKELGLTQAELAEKANVARQTIIALEGDDLPVCKTETLSKIAQALNRRVSELLLN